MKKLFGIVICLTLIGCSPAPQSERASSTTATNPQRIRGTAGINRQLPSVQNGFFSANIFEAANAQTADEGVIVASHSQAGRNHQEGLTTQWDFRMTVPNFDPQKFYYVKSGLFADESKNTQLLEGVCDQQGEYCSVVQNGSLVGFYMELLPVEGR